MEKLLSRILMLCTLIGVCFGAYTYVQERPTVLVSGLEDKIDRDLASIKEEKRGDIKALREEFSAQIQAANVNVMQQLGEIKSKLEKMDDRLYEMQRHQREAKISNEEVFSEDI